MHPFLEAVVVCDGYSDFLEETLPYTRRHVNRLVVVTGQEDKATIKLCNRLDVRCVTTWVHQREGGRIDKASAINHGLAHLGCDGWLLHLDADIVLPDRFSDWLGEHPLETNKIYGVDRWDVLGADLWDRCRQHDWMHHRREHGFMIQNPPRELGLRAAARVGHGAYGGWLPIGYFQLWHGSVVKRYPCKPNADCEHTDALFASQWSPRNRILIPDFYVLHLLTSLEFGANWNGRKTPCFRRRHHGHHHPKPYCS